MSDTSEAGNTSGTNHVGGGTGDASGGVETPDPPEGYDQVLRPPEEIRGRLDQFFSDEDGTPTIVGYKDLYAAAEPFAEEDFDQYEPHEWYWTAKPYAFAAVYFNNALTEWRYLVVEPSLSPAEQYYTTWVKKKLPTEFEYSEVETNDVTALSENINDTAVRLMSDNKLITKASVEGEGVGIVRQATSFLASLIVDEDQADQYEFEDDLAGVPRPRDEKNRRRKLNLQQVMKILYYVTRDFVKYGRIDPIKQDVRIEEISCDGYNQEVFIAHNSYADHMITNVEFGEDDLDEFVVQQAQKAGKGISKHNPDVDARLEDGSRAQFTYKKEVTEKGTNFTIRQFSEVPFTPIDLINWNTFGLDEMVYLWTCIENNKSMIVSGGTGSGKTTALNALCMFMPSSQKVVSIEDTPEMNIPHRNWISLVTRDSFREGGVGEIDEFDLIEDSLRQRPDYLIMGEVRGEEGRDLFQMLSTGHTTFTTFHADSPSELTRRFTSDPINVEPAMFESLDIILSQRMIRRSGEELRRNISVTEVGEYDPNKGGGTGGFNGTQTIFKWDADNDNFRQQNDSDLLQQIAVDERGWTLEDLNRQLLQRRIVLAYCVANGIKQYSDVAAIIQAYNTSPASILALVRDGVLEDYTDNLRGMRQINVDIDPEKEANTPRPDPDAELVAHCERFLKQADILNEYAGYEPDFGVTTDDDVDTPAEEEVAPPALTAPNADVGDDGPDPRNEFEGEPDVSAPQMDAGQGAAYTVAEEIGEEAVGSDAAPESEPDPAGTEAEAETDPKSGTQDGVAASTSEAGDSNLSTAESTAEAEPGSGGGSVSGMADDTPVGGAADEDEGEAGVADPLNVEGDAAEFSDIITGEVGGLPEEQKEMMGNVTPSSDDNSSVPDNKEDSDAPDVDSVGQEDSSVEKNANESQAPFGGSRAADPDLDAELNFGGDEGSVKDADGQSDGSDETVSDGGTTTTDDAGEGDDTNDEDSAIFNGTDDTGFEDADGSIFGRGDDNTDSESSAGTTESDGGDDGASEESE